MNFYLTPHAKKRMKDRAISQEFITDALRIPTKIMYDEKGRILVKKLYFKGGKERILLIVGEFVKDKLEIITVIDTSKVKKYL